MFGYVYIVKEPGGTYKIGWARDVSRRVGEFVKLPFPVELVHFIKSDNPRVVERDLHKRFKFEGKHVRGEWFALTQEDLRELKAIEEVITGIPRGRAPHLDEWLRQQQQRADEVGNLARAICSIEVPGDRLRTMPHRDNQILDPDPDLVCSAYELWCLFLGNVGLLHHIDSTGTTIPGLAPWCLEALMRAACEWRATHGRVAQEQACQLAQSQHLASRPRAAGTRA